MNDIEEFKDVMHKGMLQNFQNHGYLTPVFFIMKDGRPSFTPIPMDALAPENRGSLMEMIKRSCQDTRVSCAGLIMEAYSRSFKESDKDNELRKLLENGSMRVSELKEKNDIIYMVFSTPDKEDLISYLVDPPTKSILSKMDTQEGKLQGTFTNFFEFRR